MSVDAETGTALLPRGSLRDLVAAAEGRETPGAAALEAAGGLVGGRPHPVLAPAVDAVARPRRELRLERGLDSGHAWAGATAGVLAWPAGEDVEHVAVFAAPLIYGMLAELFGLGPRPHLGPAEILHLSAGELARSLAGDADAAPEPARTVIAAATTRWRAERVGTGHALDALDTPAGLWLVVAEGDAVQLLPVTPTRVWRLLIALVNAG